MARKHLEQSVACTTGTRTVTERFHRALKTHLFSTARHCWDVLRRI